MDADVYYARLNMIYSRITRQFSCSCAFYTRPSFQVSELSRTAAALQEERKNNICQSSGIFFSDSASVPQTITYCEPELLSQFEMYLSGNQAGKAEQEALLYLQSLNINNKLNHDTLVEFAKIIITALTVPRGNWNFRHIPYRLLKMWLESAVLLHWNQLPLI